MNDIAALQKSIARLVALASGLANNKIKTVRGGKLPQIRGPYCTISLTRDTILGTPSPSYAESNTANVLDESIETANEFTFSLNFYRAGALQLANNLKGAAYRSAVQAFLYTNNLGWIGLSAINNLTDVFSGETEERAQVNITLLMDGVSVSQVNQALSVDIDIQDETTPGIITFYAYDAKEQGDFIAYNNKPAAA